MNRKGGDSKEGKAQFFSAEQKVLLTRRGTKNKALIGQAKVIKKIKKKKNRSKEQC